MTSWRATTATLPPGRQPHRLARGIWLPEPSDDLVTRTRRVLLALPPHCVVVGRTAARLHGLWLPPAQADERIEVAHTAYGAAPSMGRTRRAELAGSRRAFREVDVTDVDGIRVSSPARTWRDLAGRLSSAELVALGDSVLRSGVSADDLAAVTSTTRGRRGAVAAARALPMLDAASRSRPESHMRVELAVPGWPRFAVNQVVRDPDGGWLAEPDLSNEAHAVAVEYQGERHADLARLRRDLSRAASMTGLVWQVLCVGPAEVFTHPDRLRAAVRAMFWRAGWRG